jgi:hypothetical protein
VPAQAQSSFGTAAGGFRLASPSTGNALLIEVWGYWDAETAKAFAEEAPIVSRRAAAPLNLVLEASQLKPQGVKGQAALRALLECLTKLSVSRAVARVSNILTRMQLTRIAAECGASQLLHFDTGRDE